MEVLFSMAIAKSSIMVELVPRPITSSSRKQDRWHLVKPWPKEPGLLILAAGMILSKYGSKLISRDIRWQGRSYRYVDILCGECDRTGEVSLENLLSGKTTGCSCRQHVHSFDHPGADRLRDRYYSIVQRCTNPDNDGYHNYGGRGIQNKFKSADEFIAFVLKNLPHPDYRKIDVGRIDNDGHYEPGNIRLEDRAINARNKRSNRFVTYRGENRGDGSMRPFTGRLSDVPLEPGENNPVGHAGSGLEGDSTSETTGTIPNVAPVYDILNAGPRNRFTVEGKLVHNCYGMSSQGLLAQLILMFHQDNREVPSWLTEQWCGEFIAKWFNIYPAVKVYMDHLYKMVRRYGMVWNQFGRVRQIHGIWDAHRHVVSECERQAGNMPIQGWAAEVMKIWQMMVLAADGTGLINDWREKGMVYPLLTVYDELDLECEPHIAEQVKGDLEMAEEYIGAVFNVKCPLKAEGDIYDRWQK